MRNLHVVFAWIVIFGNAAAGVWSLVAHRVARWRTAALWWFTGVVQVAIFVQVIFGVILLNQVDNDSLGFHMFYGFVAIIAVAIIYSYRQQVEQYRYLLYGGGGLFLMGLGIRAMIVNTVP